MSRGISGDLFFESGQQGEGVDGFELVEVGSAEPI
jgi:hypothetical protein